jgi:hypothetical protein
VDSTGTHGWNITGSPKSPPPVEESTGNVGVQKELATEAMRESLQGLGGNPYGFKFRCQLPHEDILHAFIR